MNCGSEHTLESGGGIGRLVVVVVVVVVVDDVTAPPSEGRLVELPAGVTGRGVVVGIGGGANFSIDVLIIVIRAFLSPQSDR